MELATLAAIAATFLLAGGVKGVIGLGLPTVSLGLLAAALLASAALVFHNPFSDPGNRGTNPLIPVVFEARLEPFDPSFSMSAFTEIGR